MIIKQMTLIQDAKEGTTLMGTIYQKKHRIVVEVGGYRFKTDHREKEDNANKFDEVVRFTTRDRETTLYLDDPTGNSRLIRAVIYPDLTVTAIELEWTDRTHTVKDLYKLYKRKRMVLI